jgi:hypothetical protein
MQNKWVYFINNNFFFSVIAGPPTSEEILKEEQLRMVIGQIHGSQSFFRAAQKFLKNRTLRVMAAKGNPMTLYERIMAYRQLQPGEEVISFSFLLFCK